MTDTIWIQTSNVINKNTPSGSFIQRNLPIDFQPHTFNHCEYAPCIEKCNLRNCHVDQGLEPFCVLCCEGQVIYFGDWNSAIGRFSVEGRKKKLYIRNPEFITYLKVKFLPLKKTEDYKPFYLIFSLFFGIIELLE